MVSKYIDDKLYIELEKIIDKKLGMTPNLALNLMKKTKKNQQDTYIRASFLKREINLSNFEIEDLVNKRILKILSKKEGRLTPTFKAILMINYKISNPNNYVNHMLNDLNDKFFENVIELSEKPIDTKEKAIIIGLLGLGAFSNEYSLELNLLEQNETNQEFFRKAIDLAADFIKELGSEFNDGSLSKLWTRNVVGEGPILGEMRRLNTIQTHTEGIYKKESGRHYLDVLVNNKIDENCMLFLLTKIFDKRPLSFPERERLISTLDKIKNLEFKIFRKTPSFDKLEARTTLKRIILSNI